MFTPPSAAEIGRLVLTVLVAAGGVALVGAAIAPFARRSRRRTSPPPLEPPTPPPRQRNIRQARAQVSALDREWQALAQQINDVEQRLSAAISHRTHWGGVIEQLKRQGRSPSARTRHNFSQRSRDVIDLATQLQTMKSSRDELSTLYRAAAQSIAARAPSAQAKRMRREGNPHVPGAT